MKPGICALLLLAATPAMADEWVRLEPSCRVLDTRNTSTGYLVHGQQLDFRVRTAPPPPNQSTPVPPGSIQGGDAFCGIPSRASGVTLSIVAVDPSTNGHTTIWPHGTAQPTASTLNITTAETRNSGVYVGLGDPFATGQPFPGTVFDLSLKTAFADAYYVIDITGYSEPSWSTLTGQALATQFGHVLVVETIPHPGKPVRVVVSDVPANLTQFKASWIEKIPAAVGNCVMVAGFWIDGNGAGEAGLFEARSLPVVLPGFCGPDPE